MNLKSFLFLIIILLTIAGIYYFFGRKAKNSNNVETIHFPPFTIAKKNHYGTRYDMNTASRVNDSRSSYSIYYQDQLIPFPKALETNTGVPGMWKAYIIANATRPTLIAGSLPLYLITEENNKAKVTEISGQNSSFASLQWLDSEGGQPGIKQEVYSSDDTGTDCKLVGGRFILINNHKVLDISDLSIYSFELNADFTNDYYALNVVAFSPDKDKIVFLGNKTDEKEHFALLTYNFKTNQAQTLPFDRNETRLHEPYSIDLKWFSTYFDWNKNPDGTTNLIPVNLDHPHNWEGTFTKEEAYAIAPVKPEMIDVFAAFCKTYLELAESEISHEGSGLTTQYTLNVGENKLNITYLDKIETVYCSPHILVKDTQGAAKIILNVGNAFNEHLSKGNHQTLFTSY